MLMDLGKSSMASATPGVSLMDLPVASFSSFKILSHQQDPWD